MTSQHNSRKPLTKSNSATFKVKEMDSSLLNEEDEENEFETNLQNFDVEQIKK